MTPKMSIAERSYPTTTNRRNKLILTTRIILIIKPKHQETYKRVTGINVIIKSTGQ